MNNSSFFTADRATHLKIVMISLIASVIVIAVGIAARPQADTGASLQASGPAYKPGAAVMATSGEATVR